MVRPAEVEVRWTDLDGAARQARFAGLDAVCVQHEIDHLDGILYTERVRDLSTLQDYTEEIEKQKREEAAKAAQPVAAVA